MALNIHCGVAVWDQWGAACPDPDFIADFDELIEALEQWAESAKTLPRLRAQPAKNLFRDALSDLSADIHDRFELSVTGHAVVLAAAFGGGAAIAADPTLTLLNAAIALGAAGWVTEKYRKNMIIKEKKTRVRRLLIDIKRRYF